MTTIHVAALRTSLGRPDSKFPATPPQATAAELMRILGNNWGLVGAQISRTEAAWLLELGTHANADTALTDELKARISRVTIGTSADREGFDDWVASLGALAQPAPNAPPSPPTGSVGLQGTLIPQGTDKVVSTKSHDIILGSQQGGQLMPDFQLRRRDPSDPEQRAVIAAIPAADLPNILTAADFSAQLTALLNAHQAFLRPDKDALLLKVPEADKSSYTYLNLTGRRLEQFFNEMHRELQKTSLTGAEATAARQAINLAYRDAFRGVRHDFDSADTGTYWSYGHDAAFVHVFEKMLEELAEGDARKKPLQAQIDYIFTHKYAPNGDVKEENIEDSIALVAIDKASRHVVSMTPDSDNSNAVRYEILDVNGRYAFRDGTQHFWEGSRTELTAAEVPQLRRTSVNTLTFRRPQTGEQLRSNFRYDWDRNRMINAREVDTGWWGHCDIKALIEQILADMPNSQGVTEFRSDSKKTVEFSRDMQLEALAALLNFDDVYVPVSGGSQAVRLGRTNFAGARNDDRPTTMTLGTNRQSIELPIRLTSLSEKGAPGAAVDIAHVFNPYIADDKNETFTKNADVTIDTQDGDTAIMDATGRKIGGTTDGYTFDERGRPVELKVNFEIDPTVTTGDKVLIGTELNDVNGRSLTRIYYDPTKQELEAVSTRFVEKSGKFEAEEGTPTSLGKLSTVELGKELEAGDDVPGKLAMLEEAVRTGRKIATDSDPGMQVWNGEIHAMRRNLEWRSADGKWERESVTIDATFGAGKVGTFLHRLDDEGRIVETMELRAAVDFYWSDDPRIAPLVYDRGNWWVNRAMAERGVVDLGAGRAASLAALQDLNDLIYLGLKAKDNNKLFTIVHEGKRYVYEDEAKWRADVDSLKTAPPPPPTTGSIQVSQTPNLSIPDNDPTGLTDTIKVDRDGKVKDVKVTVDVRHTWVGDVDMTLVAPDGTRVKLHARGGRDTDDIVGTYGADLRAIDDLASLVGKGTKGDWQLKLVDLEGQDTGTLVSWGLNVELQ